MNKHDDTLPGNLQHAAQDAAEAHSLEFFYEDVLNQLPSDVVILNTAGHYVFINHQAIGDEALRQWMIGKTDEDFARNRQGPMGIAEQRKKIIAEVIQTKQLVKWEETAVMLDGVVKSHIRHLYPVLDEKSQVKFLIGYGIDITDNKRAQEQLQVSEKKYRDLFSYSQAWICTHDVSGRLLSVNPAAYQSLEYKEEEMVGKLLSDFLPPEDRPLFEEKYVQPFLREGRSEGVFRIMSRSGRVSYLLYQNYKMDAPGMEPYVIGFAQDITSRIEMERELRHAQKMTEDAARAKEVFLANMSHEIRTPMNGVLGIAGLLAKTKLDEQQRKYLRMIQESATNLLLIVNDVLDLEKIIVGKLQFEHVVFVLADRVEMCLQSFTYKAEEKEIQLSYKNRLPHDIVVLGDPYRLNQVLNNLLSNALKFTTEGSVTVETEIVERDEEAVTVLFSVKDTGIGIPPDKLDVIFEPFMQAHSSISSTYGGTGLGLSICRELIGLMGGQLTVSSEKGKGSVFSFTLPFAVSLSKPNQMNMAQDVDFRSLGRRNVLVAEDVEMNQYLARHIMESWGFDVDIANNGKEAVDMVQQKSYDLVLMDIQMPEMDGMQATRQIRQLPEIDKASIPIIALTANVLKGDSEKYLAAGMNDYLAKPFDESQLFHIISQNLINGGSTVSAPENSVVMNTLTEKLYDLSMVRSVSGGDAGFEKRMVQLFLDTMPVSLKEIQQVTQEQKWDMVGKLAHKMKSTIDSLGISDLKQDIRTIESNGKKNEQTENIPALVERVINVMHACIDQLKTDYSL
jgi:PAS domain S-box-containing protein